MKFTIKGFHCIYIYIYTLGGDKNTLIEYKYIYIYIYIEYVIKVKHKLAVIHIQEWVNWIHRLY